MSQTIKVLCLGDVVGEPGRTLVQELLPGLRKEFALDLIIANAENAAGGLSPDIKTSEELHAAGVDVLTSGDHVWKRKEFYPFLDQNKHWAIRPANFPEGAPGAGVCLIEKRGVKIGVMNLIGRVFMNATLDCPFKKADQLLQSELSSTKIIICDLHTEATSEKVAMGRYLDGRTSLVFGTHTHVQTADEQIFSGGSAYISDLGMCGSFDSVIGMDPETAIARFTTGLPSSYKVGAGRKILCGVVCEIDSANGKALKIERVQRRVG